jgi:hypothetical protein
VHGYSTDGITQISAVQVLRLGVQRAAPRRRGVPHDEVRRDPSRNRHRGRAWPAHGRFELGTTTIVNASLVDENYQPVNPVVEIELTRRGQRGSAELGLVEDLDQ